MRTFSGKPRIQSFRVSNSMAVCQSVNRKLLGSGYLSLDKVQVSFNEGVITLSGGVPTFFMKDMAQNIAMQDENVKYVRNEIEVISTDKLMENYSDAN